MVSLHCCCVNLTASTLIGGQHNCYRQKHASCAVLLCKTCRKHLCLSTAQVLQTETCFLCRTAVQFSLQAPLYEDSTTATDRNILSVQYCCAIPAASTLVLAQHNCCRQNHVFCLVLVCRTWCKQPYLSTAQLLQIENCFLCSTAVQKMPQAPLFEHSTTATDRNMLFVQCCCAIPAASTFVSAQHICCRQNHVFCLVLLCRTCCKHPYLSTAQLLQTETCFLCSTAVHMLLQAPLYADSTTATDRNIVSVQ